MRQLEAPDAQNSLILTDQANSNRTGVVDEEGLPLVYNKGLIEEYWRSQGSALSQRWTEFLGLSVPYLTKFAGLLITGGTGELVKNEAALARDARLILEKLGPTFIKGGQMMSVRPDVLSQPVLDELSLLQDSVKPFSTEVAVQQIEQELGKPLGAVFSEISEEPVAAASLAQVYKAKLVETGEWVAVKVQRPSVLSQVSKDLFVLGRAAQVYQGLIERFAPQQRTDYVALLNEWAIGFYTELDFTNEGKNQLRIRKALEEANIEGVYVPDVYEHLCTRRLLVSEWIDGVKLSQCEQDEVRSLIEIGQEAFLTQLLKIGCFHSDPHSGNLLAIDESMRHKGRLAIIDFGLVAEIQEKDRDLMISSLIHLANKDYAALVDDFIGLGILPADSNRPVVIPLMEKALGPYVLGGGAKRYEEEIRKSYGMDGSMSGSVGGFQAMTQDALTVLNEIPFSVPPVFAILGRAIVTLEGIALTGNPDYGIIMEAYPFVARELLNGERPMLQKALQELLYAGDRQISASRLAGLLSNALGNVETQSANAFVDLDASSEDLTIGDGIKYLLGKNATSLRTLLVDEAETAVDLLARQATRKAFTTLSTSLPRPPLIGRFLPNPEEVAVPFPVPSRGSVRPALLTPLEILEAAAPKLTREEELYALALADLVKESFGSDAYAIVNGDVPMNPLSAVRVLAEAASSAAPDSALDALGPVLSRFQSPSENQQVREVFTTVSSLDSDEGDRLREAASDLSGRLLEKLQTRLSQLGA